MNETITNILVVLIETLAIIVSIWIMLKKDKKNETDSKIVHAKEHAIIENDIKNIYGQMATIKVDSEKKYEKLETDVYDELKNHREIIEKQFDKIDSRFTTLKNDVNSELKSHRDMISKLFEDLRKEFIKKEK